MRSFNSSPTCVPPLCFVLKGDKVLIQQLVHLHAPFVLKGDKVLIQQLAHPCARLSCVLVSALVKVHVPNHAWVHA